MFTPPRPWSRFCSADCRRALDRVARAVASKLLELFGPDARDFLLHYDPDAGNVSIQYDPVGKSGMSTINQIELPLDTRRAAHRKMETGRGQRLRELVAEALVKYGPKTPDEIAELLGESPLSIRPRFTELKRVGAIVDTGDRRINKSGNTAKVWRVAGAANA